jgi:succinate dehydrogenase / fumarate reductase cytochrome b subunit
MTWKEYFTSSIGKKLVMSLTGLFLITFLIIHATLNGLIFLNDYGETFNTYAHFFSHNYFIRVIELGLFAGLILHSIQGLLLWKQNNSKRPIKYQVNPGNATSKWYSRSMGILGSLLLIFLTIHLSHFWIGTKASIYIHPDQPHNLYEEMQNAFSKEWVVIVYLAGVTALCWHLLHGFRSSFQTLGINSPKYNALIRNTGYVFSILICLIFSMMPLAFYFGWIQ